MVFNHCTPANLPPRQLSISGNGSLHVNPRETYRAHLPLRGETVPVQYQAQELFQ